MVVSSVLAGCTAGVASNDTLEVSYVGLAPAFREDQGAIAGIVLDGELLPVAGARVELMKQRVATRTDARGEFVFSYLPVGAYQVNVSARGFQPQGFQVQVSPAEVSELKFALEPVRAPVPYVKVETNTVSIAYCAFDLFGFCEIFFCTGCAWTLPIKDEPSHFIFEVAGVRTLSRPTGPDALMTSGYAEPSTPGSYYLWSCNGITFGTGPAQPCSVLPVKIDVPKERLDGVNSVRIDHTCDYSWVCHDSQYKSYVSLFYNTPEDKVPSNYSAIPKK